MSTLSAFAGGQTYISYWDMRSNRSAGSMLVDGEWLAHTTIILRDGGCLGGRRTGCQTWSRFMMLRNHKYFRYSEHLPIKHQIVLSGSKISPQLSLDTSIWRISAVEGTCRIITYKYLRSRQTLVGHVFPDLARGCSVHQPTSGEDGCKNATAQSHSKGEGIAVGLPAFVGLRNDCMEQELFRGSRIGSPQRIFGQYGVDRSSISECKRSLFGDWS